MTTFMQTSPVNSHIITSDLISSSYIPRYNESSANFILNVYYVQFSMHVPQLIILLYNN